MRVTSECDTIGSFPICNRADAQFGPTIAFNGNDYIVVWSDRRFTGTYFWTTAARVTRQGAVLDTGYGIGSADAHNEFYPDIAFDGNRCFAVWYRSAFAPYGIYGRFINSMAQPEDSMVTVSSTATSLYNFPKVDFDGRNYLVVWADLRSGEADYDVFGQLVSVQGQPVGPKITVATGPPEQSRPDVTFDGRQYLVVWIEDKWVFGQKLAPSGQLIGGNFRISDTTSNIRSYPRACAGRTNHLVVWSEERNLFNDIYGNVDVVVGVAEDGRTVRRTRSGWPTIIAGDLSLRNDKKVKVYDRSGRLVKPRNLEPGVYFIEIEGTSPRKIVKIK